MKINNVFLRTVASAVIATVASFLISCHSAKPSVDLRLKAFEEVLEVAAKKSCIKRCEVALNLQPFFQGQNFVWVDTGYIPDTFSQSFAVYRFCPNCGNKFTACDMYVRLENIYSPSQIEKQLYGNGLRILEATIVTR